MIALKFYHAHQSLNITNMYGNHILLMALSNLFSSPWTHRQAELPSSPLEDSGPTGRVESLVGRGWVLTECLKQCSFPQPAWDYEVRKM